MDLTVYAVELMLRPTRRPLFFPIKINQIHQLIFNIHHHYTHSLILKIFINIIYIYFS